MATEQPSAGEAGFTMLTKRQEMMLKRHDVIADDVTDLMTGTTKTVYFATIHPMTLHEALDYCRRATAREKRRRYVARKEGR